MLINNIILTNQFSNFYFWSIFINSIEYKGSCLFNIKQKNYPLYKDKYMFEIKVSYENKPDDIQIINTINKELKEYIFFLNFKEVMEVIYV